MNYETAFKVMVAGHAVTRNNKIYFIPSTAQPTEENVKCVNLNKETDINGITQKDKLMDDWETL